MPDIEELLDRTTPEDLPPLSAGDIADLARRARHTRRRHQQRKRATVAGIVGAAAAAVLVVAAVSGSSDGGAGEADVEVMPAGPNGEPLTEPVGAWTRAADPPFAARSHPFGGTLADGRIVVWGGEGAGSIDTEDGTRGSPVSLTDGGIYDPATDTWEPIPAAPLAAEIGVGSGEQLAGDRLAVVAQSGDGTLHAAVYDIGDERWTTAPVQRDITHGVDGMAWDGETLALVRLGDVADQRWERDDPLTLRWHLGDDRWSTGAPAPLEVRSNAGAAFDGARLALWGGSTADLDDFTTDGTVADGALYDLADDRWTAIAAGPLRSRLQPALAWVNGQLVVGGGRDGLGEESRVLTDVAAYDPATQTWSPRPPVPADDGSADPRSLTIRTGEHDGTDQVLVADPDGGPGDTPQWFYGPDGEWERAPLPDARRVAGFWVATSLSRGNPGDGDFSLQVRAAAGHWLDAAAAPFGNRNRADTTLVASGETLLVVGGRESPYPELATGVWLFDLAG